MKKKVNVDAPKLIRLTQDDDPPRTVSVDDYVKAKTKALREFGYASLTEADAREQLEHVLAGHDMSNGLTVIGMFMRDEISAL